MNRVQQLVRAPAAAVEFANILLTQNDVQVGTSPKDPVWTHRKVTLWRYRSEERKHPIPVLLVFALINRPDIFDLRPGNSFVEYLLGEGFDVFLIDWGYPEEEDSEMGLEEYICDELQWGIREVLRASGQDDPQPGPVDHTGRHRRLAVRDLGRSRLVRRRLRRRGL
jgi:polyhydroxyalkanoate synthase subunit PhaC